MTTTHDVSLAISKVRQQIRDAFINLLGYDCILMRAVVVNQINRIDAYGDIKTNLSFTTSPIKLILNLAKYAQILVAFNLPSTDESDIASITATCRFADDVRIGDRIQISVNTYNSINYIFQSSIFQNNIFQISNQVTDIETKILEITNVEIVNEYNSLSKKLTLNINRKS
jgi:hypothetical protein